MCTNRPDWFPLNFWSQTTSLNFKIVRCGLVSIMSWYENLRVVHAPGMPGTFYSWLISSEERKPLVRDPGMYHDTCVTYVPWCMTGSITRGGWENVPCMPGNFAHLSRGPWWVLYPSLLAIAPMHFESSASASHATRASYIINSGGMIMAM